jgi:hypothetical protein
MKPRILLLIVSAFLSFPWYGSLLAHEDTPIRLKGNALIGLPKEYAPAGYRMGML